MDIHTDLVPGHLAEIPIRMADCGKFSCKRSSFFDDLGLVLGRKLHFERSRLQWTKRERRNLVGCGTQH